MLLTDSAVYECSAASLLTLHVTVTSPALFFIRFLTQGRHQTNYVRFSETSWVCLPVTYDLAVVVLQN